MVVVSATLVEKIYESFTYNPLTRAQSNLTFLSLMVIHKE